MIIFYSTSRRVDIPRAIANFRFFAGAARHDSVEATHVCHSLSLLSLSATYIIFRHNTNS